MKYMTLLLVCTVMIIGDLFAEAEDQNYKFIIGGGLLYHTLSKSDEFNRWTTSGKTYKLENLTGLEAYFEYLVINNLAVGYRHQILYNYEKYDVSESQSTSKDRTRSIEIENQIGYVSYFIPVGERKYWRLGGVGGWGISKYEYNIARPSPELDFLESTSGTVIMLQLFADWGMDGWGGRMGYNWISTDYSAMEVSQTDERTPDGSGRGVSVNFRYAF